MSTIAPRVTTRAHHYFSAQSLPVRARAILPICAKTMAALARAACHHIPMKILNTAQNKGRYPLVAQTNDSLRCVLRQEQKLAWAHHLLDTVGRLLRASQLGMVSPSPVAIKEPCRDPQRANPITGSPRGADFVSLAICVSPARARTAGALAELD